MYWKSIWKWDNAENFSSIRWVVPKLWLIEDQKYAQKCCFLCDEHFEDIFDFKEEYFQYFFRVNLNID